MKQKTIYIAKDGQEFENRTECFNYEKEIEIKNSGLLMYDVDGNEITDASTCKFVFCKTRDDVELFNKLYVDSIGFIGSWFTGVTQENCLYYYDNMECVYVSLEEDFEYLSNFVKTATKLMKIITKEREGK